MIDKKAYFFWANDKISWIRYMTLYSFRKLNPSWEIELYISSPNNITVKTWSDNPIQDFFNFKGTDYFGRISDLDIEIIPWELKDINGISWHNKIAPSTQSDFFRWQILGEKSGLYLDIDILFIKPMDFIYNQIKDSDIVICYHNYYSLGMVGSSGNNQFFNDLFCNAFQNFDMSQYQTAGPWNILDFTGSKACGSLKKFKEQYSIGKRLNHVKIIQENYKQYKVYNHDMELIYPYRWNQADLIWKHMDSYSLRDDCVGIHWFAGDHMSQKFNNLLTEDNFKEYDNTFTYYANKIQQQIDGEIYGNK